MTEHEPGRRIVVFKNVTVNEEFFQGHFPGAPLMPGVLMIETLAQAATLLLLGGSEQQRFDPSHGRVRRPRDASWRREREVQTPGRAG